MKRFFVLRWLPPRTLVLSAIVSGVLLSLAYPPAELGPISCIALVPVLVALYRRDYSHKVFFKTGYLLGNAFFLAHLWWIVKLLPSSSITMPWLMLPALIVLVLYLSFYPSLAFGLLSWVARRNGFAVVLVAPAMWVFWEMFRSGSELGFPWGVIGYSLARHPLFLQPARIVGLFGLGFLVVLSNVLWSRVFVGRGVRARALYGVAAILLALGVIGDGYRTIHTFLAEDPGPKVRIAIAQPDVDLRYKWDPAFTDSTFRLIERFCRDAAETDADILIFPETAAPVYLRYRPNYITRMMSLANELDMAIYIGFLDGRYEGPDDSLFVFNSSGLIDKEGVLVQYDKKHLLPFGEAIPFAWRFPSFARLDFGQANFHPGPDGPPIASRVGSLGPMICFESIFPDIAREHAARGAQILVNITNDGWFGTTPGPYQHNDMAILRSVENHRYMVRSSNTGISMVVDPVGRIVSSLGLYREGIIAAEVAPLSGKTFYTRFGDRPVLIALLALIGIGAVIARRVPR